MNSKIQPQYFEEATVSCACGNTFKTGAAVEKIQVEVCNKCHPFFTGEMKFVDTLGRVERFQKVREKAKEFKAQKVKVAEARKVQERPASLREMIDLAKKQASS